MVITNKENYLELVNICSTEKVATILAKTHSIFGRIINYFGEKFVSNDPTGE